MSSPTPRNPSSEQGGSQTGGAFELFPMLPAEVRVKIWKHVFEPQQVKMPWHMNDPPMDPYVGRFIFVNFEARQVFLEVYKRAFYMPKEELWGRKGVLFNFAMDTIAIAGSIYELYTLLRRYPSCARQLRYIDSIEEGPRQRRPTADPKTSNGNCFPATLKALSAECLITVRYSDGGKTALWSPGMDPHGLHIIERLGGLRSLLLKDFNRQPYSGPKLAAVFPRGDAWKTHFYFESSDMQHASYGRIILKKRTGPRALQEPFRVKWIANDVEWTQLSRNHDYSVHSYRRYGDIFGQMYTARLKYLRSAENTNHPEKYTAKALHAARVQAQRERGDGFYDTYDCVAFRD